MQEILKSIKYKGQYYTAGTLLKIDDTDKQEFIKKEIISFDSEKTDLENAPNNDLNDEDIEISIEDNKVVEKTTEQPLSQYDDFTVSELKAMLDNQGIEYKNRATKQELIDLLKQVV